MVLKKLPSVENVPLLRRVPYKVMLIPFKVMLIPFKVFGCLGDVAFQVQMLLLQIISTSANQSITNMVRAQQNYLNAQNSFETADHEEAAARNHRERARVFYEQQLLDYGRYEVKANDTCIAPNCHFSK